MSHDPGYWRFFAYLNLFMFSMLLLVLASNFLLVFVAWELVGLSSYLLIGFWYRKRSAALAAKKAFIVNRVGDVGFALGIMAIFVSTRARSTSARSIELIARRSTAPTIPLRHRAAGLRRARWARAPSSRSTSGCPTRWRARRPVSALIHAATMVNAGVYLVARDQPDLRPRARRDGGRRRRSASSPRSSPPRSR